MFSGETCGSGIRIEFAPIRIDEIAYYSLQWKLAVSQFHNHSLGLAASRACEICGQATLS